MSEDFTDHLLSKGKPCTFIFLKDAEQGWIYSPEDMKAHIKEHYSRSKGDYKINPPLYPLRYFNNLEDFNKLFADCRH